MAWLRLALRRLADAPLASIGIFALVLVTAGIVAIAPRLELAVADDTLRTVVGRSSTDARSVQLAQSGRIVAAGEREPLAVVDNTGGTLDAELPPSVRAVVGERYVVIDTPRYRPLDAALGERTLKLRIQPGVEAHVRFVAGRAPAGTVTAPAGTAGDGSATGPGAAIFEVALPSASAANLHARVGDELRLGIDLSDVRPEGSTGPLSVRVVGIFEPLDPAGPYWLADRSLQGPVVRSVGPTTQIDDMTALAAPAAYPDLLAETEGASVPLRYYWRYVVDAGRLDVNALGTLADDLAHLDTVFPTSGTARAGGVAAVVSTGLRGVILEFWTAWRSAEAILGVVAIGAAATAALALGLGTLLVARRRRRTVAMWQGRGASRFQLAAAALAEAVAVAVVPAAIAAVAAPALVPLTGSGPSPLLVAAVPLVVAAVFVVTGAPSAGARRSGRHRPERASAATLREDIVLGPGAASPRRLVFEAVVVAGAILGAVLLRDRGVAAIGSGGATAGASLPGSGAVAGLGADPLIAAVPALVGLAAGLVAVRLFPLLTRGASALAARRRGLVAPLALRRIARGGASNQVLLALLAIATFGVFASAALVELGRGSSAAAWQEVGASFRLASGFGTLPAVLRPLDLPHVEAAAALSPLSASMATSGTSLSILAVDAAAYDRVVAGTPADPKLPPDLLAASGGGGSGTPTTTVLAAIASRGVAGNGSSVSVGDTLTVNVYGTQLPVRVVDVRDGFPTLSTSAFLVVDRSTLAAQLHTRLDPSSYLLRVPAADGADTAAAAAIAEEIRTAAGATGTPDVTILSRAAVEAGLRDSPYLLTVQRGVTFAVLVAALYAALAVAAALMLGGATRVVEVAHLRALGLARRDSVLLAIAEHAPIVVLAFAFGSAVGLALFSFLEPGLDFPAVASTSAAGTRLDPSRVAAALAGGLPLEPAWLILVLGELVAVLGVGIAVGAVRASNAPPAAALRRGTE